MTEASPARYRAVVLHEAGAAPQVELLAGVAPGAGEALIRVRACGLCGSDLLLQDGGFRVPFPVVPGHEASGVVVALGPGEHDVRVGDLVALHYIHKDAAVTDTVPAHAHLGPAVRRMGVDVAGALAEYVVRPSSTLVRPSSPIDAVELAVLTDAVATPYHALAAVAGLVAGERLGVIGVGGIGSNAVQLGAALGADVTAVYRSDRSRDLAAALGATHLVRTGHDAVDEVRRLSPGGLDVVLVAADAPSAVPDAVAMCRPRGRVVLVAASRAPLRLASVDLIWPEAVLLGSRGFTRADVVAVQELYLEQRIRVDHLTADVRPLADVEQAFADLRRGGSTRIVLRPDQP